MYRSVREEVIRIAGSKEVEVCFACSLLPSLRHFYALLTTKSIWNNHETSWLAFPEIRYDFQKCLCWTVTDGSCPPPLVRLRMKHQNLYPLRPSHSLPKRDKAIGKDIGAQLILMGKVRHRIKPRGQSLSQRDRSRSHQGTRAPCVRHLLG